MRKVISIVMCLVLVLGAMCFSFAGTFGDVPDNHWAAKNINAMVSKGLLTGYPDGSFKPSGTITKAEFITVAARVMDSETYNSFKEGNTGSWYQPALLTFAEHGFTGQMYWDDDMNKPIDRQRACVIVKDVLSVTDYASIVGNLDDFSDWQKIGEGWRPAVKIAYGMGIMGGYPDGTFRPTGTLTRAEACAVLIRILDESQRLIEEFNIDSFLDDFLKDI